MKYSIYLLANDVMLIGKRRWRPFRYVLSHACQVMDPGESQNLGDLVFGPPRGFDGDCIFRPIILNPTYIMVQVDLQPLPWDNYFNRRKHEMERGAHEKVIAYI